MTNGFIHICAQELGSYLPTSRVVHKCTNILNQIGLKGESLNCTLGVMDEFEDDFIKTKINVSVAMYGDGCIITKKKTDNYFTLLSISYSHNMPPYLVYLNDPTSFKTYKQCSLNEKITITSYDINMDGTIISKYIYKLEDMVNASDDLYAEASRIISGWYTRLIFEKDEYDFIGITSDGLGAFIEKTKRTIVPINEIAAKLVSFKSTSGEFVKRRMKKMITDLAKDNIYPTDDLSCGFMTIESLNNHETKS
jgi:hypothetical protein